MLDSRQHGMSLIDALLGILVLSIGLVLYARNWTANYSATNSTYSRSIAASQVAEIGNILLANIATFDSNSPRGQIISRVNQFSNQLETHLNSFALASGYECNNGIPKELSSPNSLINLEQSTLPRVWAQGAASCITIRPKPSLATGTNGVWVSIEVNWVDAHTPEEQTERVSVHTLVSPL